LDPLRCIPIMNRGIFSSLSLSYGAGTPLEFRRSLMAYAG